MRRDIYIPALFCFLRRSAYIWASANTIWRAFAHKSHYLWTFVGAAAAFVVQQSVESRVLLLWLSVLHVAQIVVYLLFVSNGLKYIVTFQLLFFLGKLNFLCYQFINFYFCFCYRCQNYVRPACFEISRKVCTYKVLILKIIFQKYWSKDIYNFNAVVYLIFVLCARVRFLKISYIYSTYRPI